MAYVWAAIFGGVIVSEVLSGVSGNQPVLVGVLGAGMGVLVLFVVRLLRSPTAGRDSGTAGHRRRAGAGTPWNLPSGRAAPLLSPRERETVALTALSDRLGSAYRGWSARITPLDGSRRAVQIDHFPGLSTALFTILDDHWVVVSMMVDASGQPIPGSPEPRPLGTHRDELDETVARIVSAEVDAYRRVAQLDLGHHVPPEMSTALREHATAALRFLTPHG